MLKSDISAFVCRKLRQKTIRSKKTKPVFSECVNCYHYGRHLKRKSIFNPKQLQRWYKGYLLPSLLFSKCSKTSKQKWTCPMMSKWSVMFFFIVCLLVKTILFSLPQTLNLTRKRRQNLILLTSPTLALGRPTRFQATVWTRAPKQPSSQVTCFHRVQSPDSGEASFCLSYFHFSINAFRMMDKLRFSVTRLARHLSVSVVLPVPHTDGRTEA